jgi:tetratricopeptide (TPR) repeat protein
MKKHSPPEPPSWLEQAFPQIHYLLLALDGEELAMRWLAENSHGVALLTRALSGEKQALDGLENGHAAELDDLFELIDNDDLCSFLRERRLEIYLLFEAIKGKDDARLHLERRKPLFAKLVPTLRRVHDRFLEKVKNGNGVIEEDAMADMGCLIGEMHLRQGEYEKAIEAFTRAIDTHPEPDLYEGRARAFRLLAERDEAAAVLLRQRQT